MIFPKDDPSSVEHVASCLSSGKIAVLPTDTIYGFSGIVDVEMAPAPTKAPETKDAGQPASPPVKPEDRARALIRSLESTFGEGKGKNWEKAEAEIRRDLERKL